VARLPDASVANKMPEPQIINTLCSKRDELERIIATYETAITTARRDLMYVNATLELLERDSGSSVYPSRMSITRIFKRGEIFALCKKELAEAKEGLDTRELTLAVMRAKDMNHSDAVLRRAISFKIIQAMLRREIRGQIAGAGKRKGAKVWIAK